MIFIAQVVAGIIYLLVIPIMPESLHPSLRTHSRPASILDWQEGIPKDESILVRLAKVPAELVKPFKVLLPKVRVERGVECARKKLDWRLTYIAISYTLAMILPVSCLSLSATLIDSYTDKCFVLVNREW